MRPGGALRKPLLAVAASLSTLAIAIPGLAEIAGPDVSSWQHPSGASLDWRAVRAAGHPFAFVKATEDTSYTNPYFAADWAAVHASGMDRGAYHFAQPASPALGQANYFAAVVGSVQSAGDLPPVLDLEVTGGLSPPDLVTWTHTFLSRVQALTGRTPMIYFSPNFWINAMGDSHEFTNYPLWIARWTSASDPFPLPGGWTTWTFWQYTDAASIPGISGAVDRSRFNGDFAALTALALGPPQPPSGTYVPLTPTRILDTRVKYSGPPAPIGAFQAVDVPVGGTGGVPADATSVVLNVTVTNPNSAGNLALSPSGTARTGTSSLNYVAGETIANLVEVELGAGGQVNIYSHGASTDVILDVEGYVKTGSGPDGLFHELSPARIADTRTGLGGSGHLGPASSFDLQVTGSLAQGGGASGVPTTGVAAVVLNLTATNPTRSSYLTAYPTTSGGVLPATSTLNFPSDESLANRVIALVGPTGKVTIYNMAGTTDVVVDVSGWFSDASGATSGGSRYHAISATRLMDTRGGAPLYQGSTNPLQIGGAQGLPGGANAPLAVVLNVTPTNTSDYGFLTVFSSDRSLPGTSDIDWAPGQTNPNMVVAALGANGQIMLYNHAGTTDVVVDAVGWYG